MNINERDELAEATTIGPECFTNGTVICYKGENYTRQPQQVTTVEELDALPMCSVVLDRHGDAFQLEAGGVWRLAGYGDSFASYEVALPATVLHVGGAA